MKEDFLHYLFKTKQLGRDFVGSKNETIEIIDFGEHNVNAGPDFLNAKIKINTLTWVGQIEFHLKGSDWKKHGHQNDKAYDNVILHMVYENDIQVNVKELPLPTVELKPLISKKQLTDFKNLINNTFEIPCQNQIAAIDTIFKEAQKNKAIANRLERKSKEIIALLHEFNGDQQKVILILLGRILGGKVNALPFEELARKLDIRWFAKLNYNKLYCESLLFSISGMLNNTLDSYSKTLEKEAEIIRLKFGYNTMNNVVWKYSRMRPYGFPDIRLAQFAAIVANPEFPNNLLNDLSFDQHPSEYWKTHFRLGRLTKEKKANISEDVVNLIKINVTAPFLFSLGIYKSNQDLKDRSLKILENTKPEKNSIVNNWKTLGLKLESAFDSQALIEQKNEWCLHKKCLLCSVGNEVLKT